MVVYRSGKALWLSGFSFPMIIWLPMLALVNGSVFVKKSRWNASFFFLTINDHHDISHGQL